MPALSISIPSDRNSRTLRLAIRWITYWTCPSSCATVWTRPGEGLRESRGEHADGAGRSWPPGVRRLGEIGRAARRARVEDDAESMRPIEVVVVDDQLKHRVLRTIGDHFDADCLERRIVEHAVRSKATCLLPGGDMAREIEVPLPRGCAAERSLQQPDRALVVEFGPAENDCPLLGGGIREHRRRHRRHRGCGRRQRKLVPISATITR